MEEHFLKVVPVLDFNAHHVVLGLLQKGRFRQQDGLGVIDGSKAEHVSLAAAYFKLLLLLGALLLAVFLGHIEHRSQGSDLLILYFVVDVCHWLLAHV